MNINTHKFAICNLSSSHCPAAIVLNLGMKDPEFETLLTFTDSRIHFCRPWKFFNTPMQLFKMLFTVSLKKDKASGNCQTRPKPTHLTLRKSPDVV